MVTQTRQMQLGLGLGATVGVQICKAGVARMRKIWFSRHGESEYNMFAKIGGDSNISPQGQVYAKLLPDLLVDRVPLVCTRCLMMSVSQG